MSQTIEGFALSLQQKRCWGFLKSVPARELVSQAEYGITGKLDSKIFEEALHRVIRRHEVLRTVFRVVRGMPEPVQVVEEDFELRAPTGGRREENAPILDWNLEARSAEEHLLRVSMPSISSDYRTLQLLIEEIANEYDQVLAGGTTESEPMQYLDYAQWQADLQASSEATTGAQHWRKVAGVSSDAALLLEMPGGAFRRAQERDTIARDVWKSIEDMASRMGIGHATVVAAAWAVFCWRLQEGQAHVVLGVERCGRNFEELKNGLGPYDRTLPVEVRISDGTPVEEVVRQLASSCVAAQRYQDFFDGANQTGANPCFLFANREAAPIVTRGGLEFRFLHGESHSEPFKLKLELDRKSGSEAEFILYYDAERFAPEYVRILAERFATFLEGFVRVPGALVRDLKNVSPTEFELATGRFTSTGSAEPERPTVLDLFTREAAPHPQRPAVLCAGKILTYGELDARSNRLANLLLKLGVSPGAPVAICAERSLEMIVGLLGIQKAGAAYVPLDPGYPKDRLAFILKDCGAKLLVAQPQLLEKLPNHSVRIVELCENSDELGAQEDVAPGIEIAGETAAYIIYTSGSTGTPKGVGITHKNLAHSTAARIAYYQRPLANYLLLSSFAFDSSIAGIFWTLAQGATLTIPREGSHNDARELTTLIREYGVSHLLALPSFYQAILEQAKPEELSSLTTVIVAGEACAPELVQRHYRKLPKTDLYNEYGPTEGTVWATVHHCEPFTTENGVPKSGPPKTIPQKTVPPKTIPIGRPVPNMWVYILNSAQKPVGIAQLGEICIGGPAVSSGYLNRPDLTAEKFVPNPLAARDETGMDKTGMAPRILYRTGDIGCFRADGTIEFHGRIDEQVKIRGYRIEIGEIESVLSRHPDVREVVVLAREDSSAEKRLVAYVVARDETHFSTADLRLFAQEKLPAFMVPAQFATLRAFPLTPNGKIDRKALPAPEELERKDRKITTARNADEERLARIWAEVLKLEEVGIEENFFDLGGHSLLALQVVARVRDAFKLEFPMASFFESPTVEGMALALARCRTRQTTVREIKRMARVPATEEVLAKLQSDSGE